MKFTRRQVAASLAAIASVPAAATPQTQPASPPQADDLTAARERLKNNAGALASVPLPMSTEPAFQFKA